MAYLVILAVLVLLCLVLRRFYLPLIGCALLVGFIAMNVDFAVAMKRHLEHTTQARVEAIDESAK